jgi:hypothetical protein
MGIFAHWAGDFWRFGASEWSNGKLETGGWIAKARYLRPFLALHGNLPWQADWLAGAGGIELPNGGIKIR